MHFPTSNFRPPPAPEPPADIRVVAREDVQWNRPVFKAPPLQLDPRKFDTKAFALELRRIGLVAR
jgi:hypothetical protein